nr:copper homeostasis protein CutC [Stenotrophomonas acidaminiphila]
MVTQAADRIRIMAGAGLDAANILAVASESGCTELHASAKAPRTSAMRHHNPALVSLENDWVQSDTAQVNALRRALDQMG